MTANENYKIPTIYSEYAIGWYIQTTATGYEYSSCSMLSPLACTCCIYSEVPKVLGHPTKFRAILHRYSIKKWLVCSLLWLEYWGRLCLPLQIIERADHLLVDVMMSLVHVVDCVFRIWKKWHSNDVQEVSHLATQYFIAVQSVQDVGHSVLYGRTFANYIFPVSSLHRDMCMPP